MVAIYSTVFVSVNLDTQQKMFEITLEIEIVAKNGLFFHSAYCSIS